MNNPSESQFNEDYTEPPFHPACSCHLTIPVTIPATAFEDFAAWVRVTGYSFEHGHELVGEFLRFCETNNIA